MHWLPGSASPNDNDSTTSVMLNTQNLNSGKTGFQSNPTRKLKKKLQLKFYQIALFLTSEIDFKIVKSISVRVRNRMNLSTCSYGDFWHIFTKNTDPKRGGQRS